MRRIKKKFPDMPLVLFCRRGLGDLFKDLKLIDQFIEIDKSDRKSWKEAKHKLIKNQYHWIVSSHQSFRTACIVAQLKAQKKIGFLNWWNFWAYSHRVKRPMQWPDALRQLSLMSDFDQELAKNLQDIRVNKKFLNTHAAQDMINNESIPPWAALSVLSEIRNQNLHNNEFIIPTPYICLMPGSVWPTKRWPASSYADLAQRLISTGLTVVLLGAQEDDEVCREVAQAHQGIINLCGQTSLYNSLFILSRAEFAVSNDSGTQHMATAVEVPLVSVFGPTTLDLGYRPWGEKVRVVEKPLSCRPCGLHGARVCPIGTHECMKSINPREVQRTLKDLYSIDNLSH